MKSSSMGYKECADLTIPEIYFISGRLGDYDRRNQNKIERNQRMQEAKIKTRKLAGF